MMFYVVGSYVTDRERYFQTFLGAFDYLSSISSATLDINDVMYDMIQSKMYRTDEVYMHTDVTLD